MSLDIFDPVLRSVKYEWRPSRNYRKEIGYRDDLREFLEAKFRSYSVRSEPYHRLADIQMRPLRPGLLAIGRNIGIEIKLDLGKSARNRLQGQISDDLDRFQQIICVLLGDYSEQYNHLHVWAQKNLLYIRGLHIVPK